MQARQDKDGYIFIRPGFSSASALANMGAMKKIIAFETSCDDTAVAIIDDEGRVLAEGIFAQKIHQQYGGVVPEIGSRAHVEQIRIVANSVFRDAGLQPEDIDVVAATVAPGLLGPLMVGAQFAKGMAAALDIPFIGIHHIEGHIFSGWKDRGYPNPPFVSLIVSGGHTALYHCREDFSVELLGETRDDAAGEAFDKVGRILGFDYPAGRIIDEMAANGVDKNPMPIAFLHSDCLNFSFSGLKTHALNIINKRGRFVGAELNDFCASLAEAIASALVNKTMKALTRFKSSSLVVGGGVAANSQLRAKLTNECAAQNIHLYLPPIKHCTDNAVMIARAALIKMQQQRFSSFAVDTAATMKIEDANLLQDLPR